MIVTPRTVLITLRVVNFITRSVMSTLIVISATMLTSLPSRGEDAPRPSLWIDMYDGEPADYETMIDDLAESRVVYLGERHTLERHHATQAKIVADLAARKVPLVVALEPLESSQQPAVDRFNRGEIDFKDLAEATGWARRWSNYAQYRPVLEAARQARAPVIGLSPNPEIIRKVARGGGVARLDEMTRKELPANMQLADPVYEKLLALEMMVHAAAQAERLRPMFEAQMVRDEEMASTLARFLASDSGRQRTAVVICGSGHVAYGLGTPTRVRRRLPGVRDRIVLFSESGDVRLSPEEKAAARPIEITHEQLRQIDRPVADYLEITPRNTKRQ